jgi:hypothetical protein
MVVAGGSVLAWNTMGESALWKPLSFYSLDVAVGFFCLLFIVRTDT